MTKPTRATFNPANFAFEEGTSQEDMRLFIRGEANIEEGLCPNGCAPLIEDNPGEFHCDVCKFVMYKTSLYMPGSAE